MKKPFIIFTLISCLLSGILGFASTQYLINLEKIRIQQEEYDRKVEKYRDDLSRRYWNGERGPNGGSIFVPNTGIPVEIPPYPRREKGKNQ